MHRRWLLVRDKACAYSKERVVFDRPIAQNQGIQFLIAEAYMEIEAANLMRYKAAALFDSRASRSGSEHGEAPRRQAVAEAQTCASRPTAASASPRNTTWSASSGKAASTLVAPISTNLILSYLAEHVLGLPRSF